MTFSTVLGGNPAQESIDSDPAKADEAHSPSQGAMQAFSLVCEE